MVTLELVMQPEGRFQLPGATSIISASSHDTIAVEGEAVAPFSPCRMNGEEIVAPLLFVKYELRVYADVFFVPFLMALP